MNQQKNTPNLPKTTLLCELNFEKNCIKKMIFSTKFLTNGFFCISSYCFSILFTFNVLYVQISLELNHLYIFNKMYLLFCNFDYYFFFNVYIFQWKQIFVFYKLFLFIKYLISNWFISVWRIYLKHSLMYQRINIITNIILLYILKVGSRVGRAG